MLILGTDESHYGCLIGNLYVSGVIADTKWSLKSLNDSKKLSNEKRLEAYEEILEEEKLGNIRTYTCIRTHSQIDNINVYVALKDAYVEVFKYFHQPNLDIVVDGNLTFKNLGVDDYKIFSVIKADSKYATVMAASIIAKTLGDKHTDELHKEFPIYKWDENNGYPSKEHMELIKKIGYTKYHRMSYAPMKNMVKK